MGTTTIEDWLSRPEETGVQVIEGHLIKEPAPVYGHQSTLLKLAVRIQAYLDQHPSGEICLSPLDVVLEDHEIYQPDLIYIARENRSIIRDYIHGAPNLVAEILLPGNAKYDRGHKKTIYERHGVSEYWIIDPQNKTAEVYTLRQGRYHLHTIEDREGILTSVLLPGLAIPLSQIFS